MGTQCILGAYGMNFTLNCRRSDAFGSGCDEERPARYVKITCCMRRCSGLKMGMESYA